MLMITVIYKISNGVFSGAEWTGCSGSVRSGLMTEALPTAAETETVDTFDRFFLV